MPRSDLPGKPAAAALRPVIGFSRPHTIVGTTVSLGGLFVLARALPTPADPGVGALLLALAAALAVNVYIVGLNQLTDIEIDRINKPWLPLPARALSVPAARWLVAAALLAALVLGAVAGPWLLAAILIAAVIGTVYSLPPRLKRHHVLAAASILAVRGLVVNLLVFTHFAAPAGNRLHVPAAVAALTAVIVVFGLVIAWFKDLPDLEGDRRFSIGTLAVRLGPGRVLALGTGGLLAAHLAVAVAGAVGIPGLHRVVLAAGHVGLALRLAAAVRGVDVGDGTAAARFYRHIWTLFYAEYGVFAAAALVA